LLDDAVFADGSSAAVESADRCPSRSTVMASAAEISLSLCEIRIEAMPWRFSSSSRSSSAALSLSFRLAVGSSRISG
jgi:predicted naringenin-chalcone synthase